jgi:[methyl-Co(III) methanol-specific corrinoid protein]:coenzyme M methyltransferase
MKITDEDSSEFLLSVLGCSESRRALILPAGFLSALPLEALKAAGLGSQEFASVYDDPAKLAELSFYIADKTGASSLSLPCVLRVESEAYGGEKDVRTGEPVPGAPGSRADFDYPLTKLSDWRALKPLNLSGDGRMAIVLETIRGLSRDQLERPVIGDLVGPLSLASSLIDGTILLRAMSSDVELLCEFLDFLTEGTIRFARAQARAGARVFFLVDPFASLDILGPEFFRTFALPYINRIARALRPSQAAGELSSCLPLIVHICAEPSAAAAVVLDMECACLSLHGLPSLDGRDDVPKALQGMLLAGALDVSLLSSGGVEQAERDHRRKGFQIIASSCSLDENVSLRALRTAFDAF